MADSTPEPELTDEELAAILKEDPLDDPEIGWVPAEYRKLPPIITPKQASQLLRVNVKTLRQSCREGRIPGAIRPGKKIWRIQRDPFLRWLMESSRMHSVFTTPSKNAVDRDE